jgi:hypothetical protein
MHQWRLWQYSLRRGRLTGDIRQNPRNEITSHSHRLMDGDTASRFASYLHMDCKRICQTEVINKHAAGCIQTKLKPNTEQVKKPVKCREEI